jgi:hypothetical protein
MLTGLYNGDEGNILSHVTCVHFHSNVTVLLRNNEFVTFP